MNALTYTFRTIEPVLATQPYSGEANSATSYGYVPGSMIRGALIHAYLREHPTTSAHTEDKTRLLFFDEATRFLNAYPAAPGGERLLPMPRSWFVEKDKELQPDIVLADFAAGGDKIDEAPERPKLPNKEFCLFYPEDGKVALISALRQVTVHNASINRNEKRAGASQVFRYDALAAGQRFAGAIVGDNADSLSMLKELLDVGMLLRLGGASAGGYGLVEVVSVDGPDSDWREYVPSPGPAGDQLIVTLLSDAILAGGASPVEQLARLFGFESPVTAYQDVRLVGGFNRTWGLPLPQAWALRAGSAFVLPGGADESQVAKLQNKGIGLRRDDGFGRIAVNWQGLPAIRLTEPPKESRGDPPKLGVAGRQVADRMASRLLRDYLERLLLELIGDYGERLKGLPSPAQLSRVRLAARRAYLENRLGAIDEHLNSLRRTAQQQWSGASISSEPLLGWLKEQVKLNDKGFENLFKVNMNQLPSVAGRRAALTADLRTEFIARFIDGLMKYAVREKKRQANHQGDQR
jgi:CRISPR-associated protein Csx10